MLDEIQLDHLTYSLQDLRIVKSEKKNRDRK